VPLLQEPAHVLDLELEIVALGLGPHLHFFTRITVCFLRFLQPPGLRVLVLAEVHDPAHRRVRLRSHLHEVEILTAGRLQRLLGRHDAELLAVGADHADLANPDGFVDADVSRLAQRGGSSCVPAWRGVRR
jgi:hypothetical protein